MTSTNPHKVKEDEVLINVPVNNDRILDILDEYKDFIEANLDKSEKYFIRGIREPSPQFGLTEEHRKEIMSKGRSHDGFPVYFDMYNFKPEYIHFKRDCQESQDLYKKSVDAYHKLNDQLCTELGVRRNALAALYPKNGYIGWHNNANASSYNLIFTYSSEGAGYWEHVNPYTGNIERINDVQGWQCKASYFGAYSENDPNTLVYHSATCTEGIRITVSFIFDREHKDWWLDTIEEIKDGN